MSIGYSNTENLPNFQSLKNHPAEARPAALAKALPAVDARIRLLLAMDRPARRRPSWIASRRFESIS